MNNIVVY